MGELRNIVITENAHGHVVKVTIDGAELMPVAGATIEFDGRAPGQFVTVRLRGTVTIERDPPVGLRT